MVSQRYHFRMVDKNLVRKHRPSQSQWQLALEPAREQEVAHLCFSRIIVHESKSRNPRNKTPFPPDHL